MVRPAREKDETKDYQEQESLGCTTALYAWENASIHATQMILVHSNNKKNLGTLI